MIPFPQTEAVDSPRVILIRPGCYDSEKYTVMETFKISTMMFEIMLREDPNVMIAGQVSCVEFHCEQL